LTAPRVLAAFDEVALAEGGRRASFELASGQVMAVVGEAASGKTFLLDAVEGRDRPPRGAVAVSGRVRAAALSRRRGTPLAIAKAAQGRSHEAGRTVQVLTACRLFDDRETPIGQLTSSQAVASSIAEVLCGREELGVFDGHLDALDPWTLEPIFGLLRAQAEAEGRAFLIATNQPDLAERTDLIAVVRSGGIAFHGSPRQLVDQAAETRLEIEARDGTAAAGMARALGLEFEEDAGRLVIRTSEPEAEAARLLREGFGSIAAVVIQRPGFREALLRLA
jgi:ABC-type multidrug transport system ATPase subunit